MTLSHDYTLSLQEFQSVYSIANQCVELGGQATYKARALLTVNGSIMDFDDDVLCTIPAPVLSSTTINTGAKFNIYPNPASSKLFVNFKGDSLDNLDVTIYSSQGILLTKSNNISVKNGGIDISNLIPGVYFIQLTNNLDTETKNFIKL